MGSRELQSLYSWITRYTDGGKRQMTWIVCPDALHFSEKKTDFKSIISI